MVREIAQMETPHTWMAELMMEPDLDEAEEKLDNWINQLTKERNLSRRVSRMVRIGLPLLMEKEAIAQWQLESRRLNRMIFKKVEDAQDAAVLAATEIMESDPEPVIAARDLMEEIQEGRVSPPWLKPQQR